jgi:hypothetical protein
LAKLIRLRLAADRLQVDFLRQGGVAVDVVAPPCPVELEAEGFDEPLGIVEADVRCVSLLETSKQFGRTHEAS